MTSTTGNGISFLPPAQVAAAAWQALAAAREFEGNTAPNPPVGAALLDRNGGIIVVAAHARAGRAHAEALALEMAAGAGRLAEVHAAVVTLEPCAHVGRTGPCADRLITAGVREVWYALSDPNPTAGGGAARLAGAGLAVYALGQLAHPDREALVLEAQRLLRPFFTRIRTGRPFITVKQALDVTGSMIPPPGQKTFTGKAALQLAHGLRRRADGILTGSGTVLADQPEFTVRHVPDLPKARQLYVLDRRGRVGPGYYDAAMARGLPAQRVETLTAALVDLAARGGLELLVEAGPRVLAALAAEGLWDRWVTIRKSSHARVPDRIEIRNADGTEEKSSDVFRHY